MSEIDRRKLLAISSTYPSSFSVLQTTWSYMCEEAKICISNCNLILAWFAVEYLTFSHPYQTKPNQTTTKKLICIFCLFLNTTLVLWFCFSFHSLPNQSPIPMDAFHCNALAANLSVKFLILNPNLDSHLFLLLLLWPSHCSPWFILFSSIIHVYNTSYYSQFGNQKYVFVLHKLQS